MSEFTNELKILKSVGVTIPMVMREAEISLQAFYRYENGQQTALQEPDKEKIKNAIKSIALDQKLDLKAEMKILEDKIKMLEGI